MKIIYEMKKGTKDLKVDIDPCGESPSIKDVIDFAMEGMVAIVIQMLSQYNLSPESKKGFVDDLCSSIKRDLVPALLKK